jgi:hypothetical protein
MPLATVSPEATQLVPMQQPPPEHMLPGQHVWPGAPHCAHWPLVQLPPF